ncbi:MAG: sigma-70 family RNA polymerase sigma factor [Saprospiraceae bacterium]|nr:sigma-70 family RNA polymerase sigma factor [Saprospiraceae bacterium]
MFHQGRRYKQYSNEQLIAAYQKTEDKAVVGMLYKRYSHKVLGLCLNYLKNVQDAEDAVMEIFIHLTEELKKHDIEKFEPWLFFVCRNFCLKKLRKTLGKKNEDISEIQEDIFVESGAEKDHNKEEERLEALSDAVDRLKEDQKRCIVLFYFEKKSYKEIELQTDYSIKEIKSHLQNGKRNLKNLLIV